jgi:hypothetical protein
LIVLAPTANQTAEWNRDPLQRAAVYQTIPKNRPFLKISWRFARLHLTLFTNDVHFIIDFRQGEVAIDRGQMDSVVHAIGFC